MKATFQRSAAQPGYVLMEVLVALTIFSLAVVGMTRALNTTVDVSNQFAFDSAVRLGLEAILTESRNRDLEAMVMEVQDENLGVTYRTEVEGLILENTDGAALTDLYVLRATASWERGNLQDQEVAEIWIYRPEGDEDEN